MTSKQVYDLEKAINKQCRFLQTVEASFLTVQSTSFCRRPLFTSSVFPVQSSKLKIKKTFDWSQKQCSLSAFSIAE